MTHPILLYDGVCGLCNRFVQFVLKRDREGIFYFASLQSSLGQRLLGRYGVNAADLDTVYVVRNNDADVVPHRLDQRPDEHLNRQGQPLLARSDAALFVCQQLGGIWRLAAGIFGLLPRSLRDWCYRVIASNRYRFFGKYDACPMPSAETQSRFLDL